MSIAAAPLEDWDGDDVLAQALAWQERGRRVVLAAVVSTWGSAPRPPGSLLAVNDGGEFQGSVSGGCVESAVIEASGELMAAGGGRRLHFGVTREQAWEVGLACGGDVEIFAARLEDEACPRLERLLEGRRARRPAVLVTDLESGALEALGPDDDLEPELGQALREALRRDRAASVQAGTRSLFLNPMNPALRMLVVGAVHIAQPLARMARLAGFEVVLVDPRSGFAQAARFPGVRISREWPDLALAELAPDRRTAVVTLTHDPKLDDPALAAALGSEAFYVGSLGSRRTHAKRIERLRRAGFGEADLARIRGPVGLAIGAESPAEIAVSIVAEVVEQLRRPA